MGHYGCWSRQSGITLRYENGALNNPDGSTNRTGSVALATKFGQGEMLIKVRPNSVSFQTSIPFGSGILLVDFDDLGNVICTTFGDPNTSGIRVEGIMGTAFVTVNPGNEISLVKKAIQKALDGF